MHLHVGYLFGYFYDDTMVNASIQRIPGLPGIVDDPCTLKPTETSSGIVAVVDADSAAVLGGLAFDPDMSFALSMDIAIRPIIEPSK